MTHTLRLAHDATAGGSWSWDAATNRTDWDDGFRARYGIAPDQPPNHDAWLSRVHEEDRAKVLGLLNEMLSTTRDSWDNSFRIVRPDGTMLWIQSVGRAERDADGRLIRLTGLDLDVTEHRRAQEVLQARLEEEHDRELRLLLETSAQGFVLVDTTGTIVRVNRALEVMFGWGDGELIGRTIEQLVPSALAREHRRHRAGYVSKPYARLMGGGLDLDGQRKDGTTFPIEVSLNHVGTAGGGHTIAFVTDISARKKDAAALRERTAELEHRTAQLSRLASDLTLAEQRAREELAKTLHDGLQQLLVSAVMGLERQQPAQARRHIEEAITAARSLSCELFPPLLHTDGLAEALRWLGERTRNQYGLVVDVSADPRADSDRKDVRTLLFESVRELLFNAVKHAGVERASVSLTLAEDDLLSITVADAGVGFDPAKLADRMKSGQAGLGVFSIRERLRLLGGRLEVDSEPGRGTEFRLVAPRHQASAQPAKRSALRILIVDDHPAVRTSFRELLGARGEFQVVGEAANGIEAIVQAKVLRPDVILMDVSMPEMDGVDATRRIRADVPSVQILGLSTYSRGAEPHEIERAGAAGFFTKGTDTSRLIQHLAAMHAAMSVVTPA